MEDAMARKLARKKIENDLFDGGFGEFDEIFAGRAMNIGDELLVDMFDFVTPKVDEMLKDKMLSDGITREQVILKNVIRIRDMCMSVLVNYIKIKAELLLGLCDVCDSETCILSPMYVEGEVRREENEIKGLLGLIFGKR